MFINSGQKSWQWRERLIALEYLQRRPYFLHPWQPTAEMQGWRTKNQITSEKLTLCHDTRYVITVKDEFQKMRQRKKEKKVGWNEKVDFSGSRWNMQSYILTHSRLKRESFQWLWILFHSTHSWSNDRERERERGGGEPMGTERVWITWYNMSVNIGSHDITIPSPWSDNVLWAVWWLLLNLIFLPQFPWKERPTFRPERKIINQTEIIWVFCFVFDS